MRRNIVNVRREFNYGLSIFDVISFNPLYCAINNRVRKENIAEHVKLKGYTVGRVFEN